MSEQQWYGPTDGSSEYVGDWFAEFENSTSPFSDKIFIALDIYGKVLYINQTGEKEFPYCRNGYTITHAWDLEPTRCFGQELK